MRCPAIITFEELPLWDRLIPITAKWIIRSENSIDVVEGGSSDPKCVEPSMTSLDKLSRSTSTQAKGGLRGPVYLIGYGFGLYSFSATFLEASFSKGWGWFIALDNSRSTWIKSKMVSVAAEKTGGDSVHPIEIFFGIDANLGSAVRLGNGKANLRAPVGFRRNLVKSIWNIGFGQGHRPLALINCVDVTDHPMKGKPPLHIFRWGGLYCAGIDNWIGVIIDHTWAPVLLWDTTKGRYLELMQVSKKWIR